MAELIAFLVFHQVTPLPGDGLIAAAWTLAVRSGATPTRRFASASGCP
jgi:hypothetical protein